VQAPVAREGAARPVPPAAPPRPMPKIEPKRVAPPPAPPRRQGLVFAAAAVVAGLVAATAWFALRGNAAVPAAPAAPAASAARADATPVPAPAPVALRAGAGEPAPKREAAVEAALPIRQVCDGRLLVARMRCLDRECRKPVNRSDPDCVQHLEERRRRAEP
jgi:hypothetical protein